MSENKYYFTGQVLIKSMSSLIKLLEKTKDWSIAKDYTDIHVMNFRLFEDMLPFVKQIQMVSDNAKGMMSRFTGVENPSYEDNEQTLDDLIIRLKKTIEFVKSLKEDDFQKTDSKQIILPYFKGMYQEPIDYLCDYAIPNFFFHKVTAYNILRHHGMPIGKADYIGEMNLQKLE